MFTVLFVHVARVGECGPDFLGSQMTALWLLQSLSVGQAMATTKSIVAAMIAADVNVMSETNGRK